MAAAAPQSAPAADARTEWLRQLTRLADPVLTNLAAGTLKRNMPVEAAAGHAEDRKRYSHLEALGRLLTGIAPWLEAELPAGDEQNRQQRYRDLARAAIDRATDPASPDFLNFHDGQQPLVDCGFLSQAVLRAPNELWTKLPQKTRRNLAEALASSRVISPPSNNWLLFSAMVETALAHAGEAWIHDPVDRALLQHQQWYLGDGVYGDGPHLHCDYYNSFVIQPMLLDVLRHIQPYSAQWSGLEVPTRQRAQRYAAILERLIAPDGWFPVVGRSVAYRTGAMQVLAQMALEHTLPPPLTPPRVRAALEAVMRRLLDAPGTFDAHGWLTIGFCGHQPHLGEDYISTGSLYLCSVVLLPLGLAPGDPFWQGAGEDWTSRRIARGEDLGADHAI